MEKRGEKMTHIIFELKEQVKEDFKEHAYQHRTSMSQILKDYIKKLLESN